MNTASVDIISVTYNSQDEVEDYYRSLQSQDVDFDLYFVDNASQDGTLDRLKAMAANDARLHVIANDRNVGLAAANNQPIGQLRHEYVAIINPDLIIGEGALGRLIQYLQQHLEVVAVGPVNVDEHGQPHSSFHRSWTLAHLIVWRLCPVLISRFLYRWRRYDEQDVLFVSGACLVTRRKVFEEIGGYDPEYFLTVEDVCDLCIRLSKASAGGAVRLVDSAQVTHLRHRSFNSAPFVGVWQGVRGSVYHFRKHHGVSSALAATAILLLASGWRTLANLLLWPFGSRFARNCRFQARVFGRLLTENPIALFRKSALNRVRTEP